jgi:hypothetical protein
MCLELPAPGRHVWNYLRQVSDEPNVVLQDNLISDAFCRLGQIVDQFFILLANRHGFSNLQVKRQNEIRRIMFLIPILAYFNKKMCSAYIVTIINSYFGKKTAESTF